MNKISERIIDIEDLIEDLIEDVYTDVEFCKHNKEEIEQQLIASSDALGKVYNLNKKNFPDKPLPFS